MNARFLVVLGACAAAMQGSFGADLNFPAGSFENGTASSWETSQTGTASVSTPTESGNTFGRISISGTGTGSFANIIPTAFAANSVYVVSVKLRSSTMAALASGQLTFAVVDGNGNVVKQLSQDEMLNVFGANVGSTSSSLTPLLQALAGQTGLLPKLRILLVAVESSATPDTLLAAIHTFLDTLVGEDPSVLAKVINVLDQVLGGTLDLSTLNDSQLATLLGVSNVSPLIAAVRDLVAFLPAQNGPIVALVNVLRVLTSSTLQSVDNLLAAIVGDGNLLGPVTDILAYALGDNGLLASLTGDLTRSLLGGVDPAQNSFQPVSMIFTTGSTPPQGGIGLRLSSGANAAASQIADVDDVGVKQFALASPPAADVLTGSPVLKIFGRAIRVARGSAATIRGTATVPLGTATITQVKYRVLSAGHRTGFRKAPGASRWHVRVKLQGKRTRVLLRAYASDGGVSAQRRVVLVRRLPLRTAIP
jgi:hypothetical protein